MPWPSCHNTLISEPRRPRNTKRLPLWIAMQRLLHQQRQPVKTLAHVGMVGGQPDLHAARDRDHRRPASLPSVLMIAETIAGSAAPAIRIRAPPAPLELVPVR